jgi:hypothetical protein
MPSQPNVLIAPYLPCRYEKYDDRIDIMRMPRPKSDDPFMDEWLQALDKATDLQLVRPCRRDRRDSAPLLHTHVPAAARHRVT